MRYLCNEEIDRNNILPITTINCITVIKKLINNSIVCYKVPIIDYIVYTLNCNIILFDFTYYIE